MSCLNLGEGIGYPEWSSHGIPACIYYVSCYTSWSVV